MADPRPEAGTAACSAGPQNGTPKAGSRGGAPRGNANATTHGLRGSKFPPGARGDESHVHRLLVRVRAAAEAKHGCPLPLYVETVLLRIRRAEASARLAARWLRKEGESLPLTDRTKLLEMQNVASDVIDRCLQRIGLDGPAASNGKAGAAALYHQPLPIASAATADDGSSDDDIGDFFSDAPEKRVAASAANVAPDTNSPAGTPQTQREKPTSDIPAAAPE